MCVSVSAWRSLSFVSVCRVLLPLPPQPSVSLSLSLLSLSGERALSLSPPNHHHATAPCSLVPSFSHIHRPPCLLIYGLAFRSGLERPPAEQDEPEVQHFKITLEKERMTGQWLFHECVSAQHAFLFNGDSGGTTTD